MVQGAGTCEFITVIAMNNMTSTDMTAEVTILKTKNKELIDCIDEGVHHRGGPVSSRGMTVKRQETSTDDSVIEGTLSRILYRGDDLRFAVGLLQTDDEDTPLKIAGELGSLEEGDSIRVIGHFRTDPKFGRQFKVKAAHPIMPHTREGLVAYLSSGRIQSIGPKLAERIVAYFGLETLDILVQTPERLAEVDGIGPKRCSEIASQVRDQVFQRDALIFLQGLHIGPALANRIWQRYEERTIGYVRDNPYRLAEDITGVGFKTADHIAQKMGFDPTSPVRAAAGIIHCLGRALDEGHVFLPRDVLFERLIKLLGDNAPIEAELDRCLAEGRLVDDRGIYLHVVYDAELELGERLSDHMDAPTTALTVDLAQIESRLDIALAPSQRDAIELAASSNFMVLTGGPGTGKTTTVRAIWSLFASHGLDILMAAPTGRASKRLAEATGATATTIRRLLGYHPVEGFRHDEDDPLDADVVVIDESSMLDQNLALGLMRAMKPTTRLILVGDSDQLPSVGAGNVLSDILHSEMADTVRLKTVFRQSEQSDIVTNAYSILSGDMPESGQVSEDSDFFVVRTDTSEKAAHLIERLVTERIPRKFGLDPTRDIQVLAPMHRGHCGAHALNERLQDTLNPDGVPIGQGPRGFRVGDKVMQVKNDYQKEVFNGDVGRIVALGQNGITVDFDGRYLELEREAMNRLVLAYACSVHKSQGSEYPAVVIPVLTEHWLMLQRNLLYTAVTRGKALVVLVAQDKAMKRCVRNEDGLQRYTQLYHRLMPDNRCVE